MSVRKTPILPRVFTDEQVLALDTRKRKRFLKECQVTLSFMQSNLSVLREDAKRMESSGNYRQVHERLPNTKNAIDYLEMGIPTAEENVRRIEQLGYLVRPPLPPGTSRG